MAEADRPNNGAIFGNILGTVVAIVVVTIGVFEYVKYEIRGEVEQKTMTGESTFLRQHRVEEDRRLMRSQPNDYQWVDQGAGVVRIPIDRAVELTLADWPKRASAAPKPTPVPPVVEEQGEPGAPEGDTEPPAPPQGAPPDGEGAKPGEPGAKPRPQGKGTR